MTYFANQCVGFMLGAAIRARPHLQHFAADLAQFIAVADTNMVSHRQRPIRVQPTPTATTPGGTERAASTMRWTPTLAAAAQDEQDTATHTPS